MFWTSKHTHRLKAEPDRGGNGYYTESENDHPGTEVEQVSVHNSVGCDSSRHLHHFSSLHAGLSKDARLSTRASWRNGAQ